ncbi:E3 ubiquitin ligase family protein [Streptomyces pinistramenti]|uniref:E3 ubiquitin ligase family protein n=1 Tax=Streptomyces pinistramenti TaxID=2884812 RepID=UPI001D087EF9|nr:E3 ubiquitin ligase family protein [Streptomyces pinistramenti]MCB5911004.1 E3 ubiquitin ligase family protein [Streptomyces pinistramenti]
MIPFLGIFLVGFGVLSTFQVLRAKKRIHTMVTTETLSAQELGQLHRAALEAVGAGAFRQLAEVAGVTRAAAAGPLTSQLSRTECVWFRTRITRSYETRGNGPNQLRKKSEVVSDFLSPAPFHVEDATGRTAVLPGEHLIDRAPKTHDRFEPYRPGDNPPLSGPNIPGITRNQRTLGFQQEEWAVAPGARFYARGEARDDERGELAVSAPADGSPFLMAAVSEQDLIAAEQRKHAVFRVFAWACTPAGGALLALSCALDLM